MREVKVPLVEPRKKGPERLVGLFFGDEILPSYIGIKIMLVVFPYLDVPDRKLGSKVRISG